MHRVLLALLLAAPAAAAPPLVIEVHVPDAPAETVVDAAAVPLESAVAGADGVARVRSLSADGRTLLRLDLDPRADRARVRAAVAARIAAARNLPEEVMRAGVKLLPDVDDSAVVMALRSQRRGLRDLSVVAAEVVRPRLTTVPGVAAVVPVGQAEEQVLVLLDTDRLAAFDLAPVEVVTALRAAPRGADLRAVTVASSAGQPVRLADVARVEAGVTRSGAAGVAVRQGDAVTSHPAVFLLVRPAPGAAGSVGEALARLAVDLGLPADVSVEVFRFSPDGPAATLRMPDGVAADHRDDLARRAAGVVALAPQVRSVCWIAEPGDGPITLFTAGGSREDVRRALRAASEQAAVRVGGFRPSLDGWPGDGATVAARVCGADAARLREVAGELSRRLADVHGVTEIETAPAERARPHSRIDNDKMTQMGVAPADARQAIELAVAGLRVGNAPPGRDVVLRADNSPFGRPDLGSLRVRGAGGVLVPLRTFVELRMIADAGQVYREGGRRCVVVSCNVADRMVREVRDAARALARELARPGVTVEVD